MVPYFFPGTTKRIIPACWCFTSFMSKLKDLPKATSGAGRYFVHSEHRHSELLCGAVPVIYIYINIVIGCYRGYIYIYLYGSVSKPCTPGEPQNSW